MNSRRPSNKVKSLLDSTADPEAAIIELRRQKVESKLYHVRTKSLPKEMKKVKIFMTQRVVKKIKQKKAESSVDETEIKKLESELNKVKAIDHTKVAEWAFNTQLLKKEEYLQEKLRELGIVFPETEPVAESASILSVKCFQDALKACRSDLNMFLRKLLHEAPVERKEKKTSSNEKRVTENGKKLSADKSFFMSSLNENDSDAEDLSDFGSERNSNEAMHGRVAFTDDEDEEFYADYQDEEEEPKPKKKKNRLGQVARRRLAEKMYGREANHIKKGGMTVQQREELRKQKSQQRKERSARIKKDAAKVGKPRASQELINSFKGSSSTNTNSSSNSNNSTSMQTTKIDPKMHPSWAAKLQQQAKLQQASFQGQKIKFDEE